MHNVAQTALQTVIVDAQQVLDAHAMIKLHPNQQELTLHRVAVMNVLLDKDAPVMMSHLPLKLREVAVQSVLQIVNVVVKVGSHVVATPLLL